MLFHDIDNNIILFAWLHDGLYKVDHIAGLNERALCSQDLSPSADVDMKIMESISNAMPTDAEIVDDGKPLHSRAEILEKRRNERYWLHHCRCGCRDSLYLDLDGLAWA